MDYQIVDLLKWAGPAAALIYFGLRELKERRSIEDIVKGYERLAAEQQRTLAHTAETLAQLIERLEPGSALTDHISHSTQVLTRLCERIEGWDRRINTRGGA